jgi:hypothetical protein
MKERVVKAESINEQIKLLRQRSNCVRVSDKMELWVHGQGLHLKMDSSSAGISSEALAEWLRVCLITAIEERIAKHEEEFAKL